LASLVGKIVGTIGDDLDRQQGVPGIALDPTDGTIYAIHGAACRGAVLMTLNPATGRSIDAGVIIQGPGFDGSSTVICFGGADSLAFDADGNLYVGGWNGGTTGGAKLLKVNKDTGAVLSLFPMVRHAAGLAFDSSGNLWASHGGNSVGKISKIDKTTGAILSTLTLSESSILISDLTFASDGTLYGSVPTSNKHVQITVHQLVTIDTGTGVVANIGGFGTEVGGNMSGLAFVNPVVKPVLWGSSSRGSVPNPSSVFGLDPNNGLATLVGKVVGAIDDDTDKQQGIPGIATDPTDATIYGIHGASCRGARLITLNPETGRSFDAGVIIQGLGFDGSSTVNCVGGADSLAVDTSGNLYVGGFNGGTAGPKLLTVGKATGDVLSLVACNKRLAGLAFDSSGNLWASHGAATQGLISRINPATCDTLLELELKDEFMLPLSIRISDLEFDPDGTGILYASVPNENRLVTINTVTGVVTSVGPFGADVSRISGLAFVKFAPKVTPIAKAGSDQSVGEGDVVTLDGSASTDPNGDPLAFDWTQIAGPGVTLLLTNPDRPTFTAPEVTGAQILTFVLVVTDPNGNMSEPDTVDIVVQDFSNNAPIADAGDDLTVREGTTGVTLNGSGFDPDGPIALTFLWTQIDGPSVTLSGADTSSPTFTAPSGVETTLDFQLQVTDDKGLPNVPTDPALRDPVDQTDDIVSVFVGFLNNAPVANAGPDQTVNEGSTVTLSGSFTDPDGDGATFQWTQNVGTLVVLSDDTLSSPTFPAPLVGLGGESLTFQLVVTDDYAPNPLPSAKSFVVIEVLDVSSPPPCGLATASRSELWPPDHSMQFVTIEGVIVLGDMNNATTVEITGITQDEPVSGVSTGDGNTSPDAVILLGDAQSAVVRAERNGTGDGRVYTINFQAFKGLVSCVGSVEVSVPLKRKSTALDSGQDFDSTVE